MKRILCLVTAAAACLWAAATMCPAYAQSGQLLSIKYKIEEKQKSTNDDEDDDDWRKWISYDFQYDNSGRLANFTHMDDNFYEFFKLEYTSLAIVSTSGNNDMDAGDYTVTVVYYLNDDKPEFISSAYYTRKKEWSLDIGAAIPSYNDKGELTSIQYSSDLIYSYNWKNGNLVSIKDPDNSIISFEYGSAQNKLGPLAYAMPMIQLYSPMTMEVFVAFGISPKSLPVKVIEQIGNRVTTHTLSYKFNSDGYPIEFATDDGDVFELIY